MEPENSVSINRFETVEEYDKYITEMVRKENPDLFDE